MFPKNLSEQLVGTTVPTKIVGTPNGGFLLAVPKICRNTRGGDGWMGGWGDGWLENVFLKKTSSPKFGLGTSDFGVCQF